MSTPLIENEYGFTMVRAKARKVCFFASFGSCHELSR